MNCQCSDIKLQSRHIQTCENLTKLSTHSGLLEEFQKTRRLEKKPLKICFLFRKQTRSLFLFIFISLMSLIFCCGIQCCSESLEKFFSVVNMCELIFPTFSLSKCVSKHRFSQIEENRAKSKPGERSS